MKRTLAPGERPKNARTVRQSGERVQGPRPAGKSPRLQGPHPDKRAERHAFFAPPRAKAEGDALPTKVQIVVVTADEDNLRVDRFLEARFPGVSFFHIQRIVRKGELHVNGKRADSKDRLVAGSQSAYLGADQSRLSHRRVGQRVTSWDGETVADPAPTLRETDRRMTGPSGRAIAA